MNRLLFAGISIWAAGLVLGGEPSDELRALDGIWLPAKAELAGQAMSAEILKTIRLELHSGKYDVRVGTITEKGNYVLDAAAQPKAMVIRVESGPNSGKSIPAIYELHGDTLRVCYDLSSSGAKKPTEFKTTAGTQLYLVTYDRQK